MKSIILALLFLVGATDFNIANAAPISIRVGHVTVPAESTTVVIPVWIDSPLDSVAGIEIFFQLNRPDIIKFETTIDTLIDTLYWNCLSGVWPACTDSVLVLNPLDGFDFISTEELIVEPGKVDTIGSLVSGWQYLDSRSLGGQGWDLKVAGLANKITEPFIPGFAPQTGGLLFNLIATIVIPDTSTDRIVEINIPEFLDLLSFSDPNGNSIGVTTTEVPDTSFWFCEDRDLVSGDCLSWNQVAAPPYDSTSVDTVLVPSLEIDLSPGSVTVLPPSCCETAGDINHSGEITIADVTYGIGRIFSGFAPPYCGDEADANGDGTYSIPDVIHLIAYIFSGGPEPICGTTGN